MTHLFGRRILVTGGAGFLGSHLCAKLIAGYDGRVSIAAVHGPEMLTLSGDKLKSHQLVRG